MNVRFHATLRQAVGGRHVVVDWQEGLTVWGFVTQMIERYPSLGPQLLDADGKLARHVHVMVNGRDAPYLCDGPGPGGRKTCDRPMCEAHRTNVGNDVDLCSTHEKWRRERAPGLFDEGGAA